jgi:uncharacterized protein YjbJ (UPF0337 family)
MTDKGYTDKIKGKTKETIGDLRGDDKQKAEGILDQAIGKTKEVTSDIKEISLQVNVYLRDIFYYKINNV